MRRWIFLLIALLCLINLNAQDTTIGENTEAKLFRLNNPTKPFGINTGVAYANDLGDLMTTISIDYFFNPDFRAIITYGVNPGNIRENFYYIGLKKWSAKKYYQNRLSPYIGLSYGRIGLIFDGEIVDDVIIWEKDYFSFIETPIGLSYTTAFKVQTSFQLSHFLVYDYWAKEYFSVLETPIGISYATKFGLQTSLQLSYFFEGFYLKYHLGPIVKLKIGWRFNLKKG